jgi:integrase/recombinase XerD
LISLLALNGLRVSEAIGADIEDLGLERGHRTPTILRKGGKVVTIPLAPRTARAIDLAVGERCEEPIFVGTDGRRIDRHAAGPDCAPHRPPGRDRQASGAAYPRHAFITAALDAGVPLRDVQEAASHADPAPPCATTGRESPSTGTPPTSWPPSSPAPAADTHPPRSGKRERSRAGHYALVLPSRLQEWLRGKPWCGGHPDPSRRCLESL